jgi:hypothetical protein
MENNDDCKDIKKGWKQIARRLQEFASHAKGRSKFISITIAVDADNNPIFWYEPQMKKIEPKMGRTQLITLLANMVDDDGNDAKNL